MWLDYMGNAVIYYLQKLPLIGSHVPKAWFRQKKTVHGWAFVGFLCRFLWEMFKRACWIALFVFLPRLLFIHFSETGEAGFGIDNSYTYFALIMLCFAGSLMRSQIFRVSKHSVTFLKSMKMDPTVYFRRKILHAVLMDFSCYWALFTIYGMIWYKSFYLAILIMLSRFVGETIQILVFRITEKRLDEIKGANIFIMLISLFAAYFLPYIRECVPATYHWVFQTVSFTVIMVMCAFFIYYVWNYSGYKMIATKIHTYHGLMSEDGEKIEREEPVSATQVSETEFRVVKFLPKINVQGYRYLNWLFFNRNREFLGKHIGIRLIVVLIALFIALVVNMMGHGDITYKVIVSSIPVMAFVMYALSLGDSVCKALFSQCDRYLLHYGYYRRPVDLMDHYLIRLRFVTVINLIPAVALCVAYIIAGISSGVSNIGTGLVISCLEIITMNLVFSVLQMGEYYLLQPYTDKVEMKNPFYMLLQLVLLAGGYGCIFISALPLHFLLGTVLVLAIVLSGSVTLVWKFSYRTFRVYQK